MNATSPPEPQSPGLSSLPQLELDDYHGAIFELARKTCAGPATARHRLTAEARDLLALAQLSRRLHVHWLDLSSGLRAKVELEVPVPCLPDPAGPLQIAPRALLGLLYPQEAIFLPQPGHAFVRILDPRPVWLASASRDHNQIVCLGPSLPAGIPLKEIVLMTYAALSMQTTQINLLDSAGVVNPAAALWWQAPDNARRIPLSREPFLRSEASHAV